MNVRPSREVTLHSHRHGAAIRHALRDDWPLCWRDVPRVLVALLVVAASAAALTIAPTLSALGALTRFDRDAAAVLPVEEGTAPHALATLSAALGAPWLVVAVLTVVAVQRLRRWHIWRTSLLVVVPLVLIGVAIGLARLLSQQISGAPVTPSAHTAGALVLGSAIGLADLDPSRPRIVITTVVTVMMVLSSAWGRLALGADRATGAAAGALVGLTALAASWVVARGAQRRHLDRAIEAEMQRWPRENR